MARRWWTFGQMCAGLVLAGVAAVRAQVPVPDRINPASAHSADWCTLADGMGGQEAFARPAGADAPDIDIGSILLRGCAVYAAAHSGPFTQLAFVTCMPRLPDAGRLASFGGERASFLVDGTLAETAYGRTRLHTGGWAMATCGCTDQRQRSRLQLGNDGQCYCPAHLAWDDERRSCVTEAERRAAARPQPRAPARGTH